MSKEYNITLDINKDLKCEFTVKNGKIIFNGSKEDKMAIITLFSISTLIDGNDNDRAVLNYVLEKYNDNEDLILDYILMKVMGFKEKKGLKKGKL